MAEKETKYYSFPPYSPYRDRTTSDKDKNILSGLSHFIDIGSKKSPNVEINTTKTMTDKDYAPLSSHCVRALCDKMYDKRKAAALEIEKYVVKFSS